MNIKARCRETKYLGIDALPSTQKMRSCYAEKDSELTRERTPGLCIS